MSEIKETNAFKIQTSSLRAYTMLGALALIWIYFHWATGAIFFDAAQFVELDAANVGYRNYRRRNADGHCRRAN